MAQFDQYWAAFWTLVETGEVGYKFMLPLYVGMIFLERLTHFVGHYHYDGKDAWTNVFVSSTNFVFGGLVGGVLQAAIYLWIFDHLRLFTLPHSGWGFLAVFVLHDFIYWLDHYVAHRTGLFWAFHHIHHQSRELNFTTAARGFILDGFLTQPLYYLLPLLGVSFPAFIAVKIITNIWGIFNHTRRVNKMGILDEVLATPANHRVHHGSDPKYLDRNYGQVLILWDRLFGTFQREEEEPTYGLTYDFESHNLVTIQLAGIRWLIDRMATAERWRDKLGYLYHPPGWDHNGQHETTETLQARAEVVG